MKHLTVMFLIIGTGLLFFSCSEDQMTTPELSQENTLGEGELTDLSFSKMIATFSGRSDLIAPLNPGITTSLPGGKTLTIGRTAHWYDDASDWRVTGDAIWTVNQKLNKDGHGQVWGTAEMSVADPNNPTNPPVGKWEMTWHGVIWGNPAQGNLYIKGIALGEGTEGVVEGLVAKWTYILDQANVGFYYTSEGFIREQ
ncbi:MAG: hypothetical protein JSW33_13595 [bacterium]|nr:MAG: hypothetical protein JSW33_13595 [bacterium]